MEKPADPTQEYDPVFLHARREAIIIFFVWVAALLWAVPFCYINGYGRPVDPETFATVLGMPAWLFWGIFVPWLVADAFTIWFCFFYMQDDELGEAHEGADLEEELAEKRSARHGKGGGE